MGTEELVSSVLNNSITTLMIVVILTMIGKDAASKVASGVMFKLNPNFNAGDRVYLGDDEAIILSIGVFQTQFEIIGKLDDNEDCTKRLWRFIPNDRLNYASLSKIK